MDKFVLEEIALGDRQGLSIFVHVPWYLWYFDKDFKAYRNNWRTPLKGELLGSKILGITGLLTPEHPYHNYAEVSHWIARSNKRLLGRISASVTDRKLNFKSQFNTAKIGFFGFFDSVNNQRVANALLKVAEEWLRQRGCSIMMGPGGYSNATHEPYQGVLVSGFDSPPSVELTYNPPFYSTLLESYGLVKAKDYVTYDFSVDVFLRSGLRASKATDVSELEEKVNRTLERITKKEREIGIEIRTLNIAKLRDEIKLIVSIYNEAWKHNWGFTEITEPEAEIMADSLRQLADSNLILFGYHNSEPVAVFGGIPDPYAVLKPNFELQVLLKYLRNSDIGRVLTGILLPRIANRRSSPSPHVRVMFFGIKDQQRKKLIATSMMYRLMSYAFMARYETADASLLLEDNRDVISLCQHYSGRLSKTYRIYYKPIALQAYTNKPALQEKSVAAL